MSLQPDVSSYPRPQVQNPLEQMGTVVGIANALQQNQNLKLQAMQTQLQNKGITADNYQKFLTAADQAIGSHLADPQYSAKALRDSVMGLHASFPDAFDTGEAAQMMGSIPENEDQGRAWIAHMAAQTDAGRQTIGALLPRWQEIQPGMFRDVNPLSQTVGMTMGQQIPAAMGEGERMTPQTIPGPEGGTTIATKGQIAAGQSPLGPQPVTPGVVPAKPAEGAPTTTPTVGHQQLLDYAPELGGQVQRDTAMIQNVQHVGDMMEQARTGGGTELRGQLGQWAQSVPDSVYDMLGIKKDDFIQGLQGGTGPLAFPDYQVMRKLLQGVSVQQAEQMAGPKGMNKYLEQQFAMVSPSPDTDPVATKNILDFWGKLSELHAKEQSALSKVLDPQSKFYDKTATLPKWQAAWLKSLIDNKQISFTPSRGTPTP